MKDESLWRVIRALDTGEHRLCKAVLDKEKGQKGKAYRTIFSALYKMDKYDDADFMLTIKDVSLSGGLALNKTRLKNLIIKLLGNKHDEKRPPLDPYKLWREAKVYIELGLYRDAKRALVKAIRTAGRQEEMVMEIRLREMLREVLRELNPLKLDEQITANELAIKNVADQLQTLIKYEVIKDQMLVLVKRKESADGIDTEQAIKNLMAKDKMRSPLKATSILAQMKFYSTRCMYHKHCGKHREALVDGIKVLRLWDEKPGRKLTYPHFYNRALANTVGLLCAAGRADEGPHYLTLMRNTKVSGKRDMAQKFCDVELQTQYYYLNTGGLKELLKREVEVEKGLKGHANMISEDFRITLRYNLGIAHHLSDNSYQALKHFRAITGLGNLSVRPDLLGSARAIQLLIEREDINIDNHIQNAARFFRKRSKLHQMEMVVVKWLKKHYREENPVKKMDSYAQLSDLMAPFCAAKHKGADEIAVWATSMATGKPINELYREAIGNVMVEVRK